jgi:spermidine synthase
MKTPRPPFGLAYLLFFLSGGAGLGYQLIWGRMLTAGLGHELPAILAVLAAFLCGLALGAWALDRRISRSLVPARWYGLLELIIGVWGALTVVLIPVVNPLALAWIGLEPSAFRHSLVAFGVPLLVLLPATAAMGATFPAMERFVSGVATDRRCVGRLYALNTSGAVLGILLATWWLMPVIGLRGSALALATVNLVCGVLALALPRLSAKVKSATTDSPHATGIGGGRLRLLVFATGLLGIGYEVIGLRVLSQSLENTIYTYAAVLMVYLLGTSVGAAFYQRLLRRFPFQPLLGDLLGGLALTGVIGIVIAGQAVGIAEGTRELLGHSVVAAIGVEMVVAATVFLLPTLLMGATFSHLVQGSRREDGGVGSAIAWNALGGACAPVVFGVLLLPAFGAKWTWALLVAGYLALLFRPVGWRWFWVGAPAALGLLLPLVNLRVLDLPPGATVVAWREGMLGSIAVIAEPDGHRVLRVNNRHQMGGTGALDAEVRHAHIPLLLHPAPRRVLVLGAGTGITFGAVTVHPDLEGDGVELVPQIVEMMPWFEPENRAPTRHPLLRVHAADARRYVIAAATEYDVIIADLFHPARDGAGMLYTREHFDAIRRRLTVGGLFCQWLPLHQLDDAMLRQIMRTFLAVFPETHLWLLRDNVDAPVVGLVGFSRTFRDFQPGWIESRLSHEPLQIELRRLALADSIRFFGHWLAGPQALRDFAGTGPLNLDHHPRVLFGAPLFARQRGATPYGRLVPLLGIHERDVPERIAQDEDDQDPAFRVRWEHYRRARDIYLHGLILEAQQRHAEALGAFVESARVSSDFTTGYARCLTLAALLAERQPETARDLLLRLIEAQPAIPVAGQVLDRLGL